MTTSQIGSYLLLFFLVPLAACAESVTPAADHCLEITLTGTQGGPPAFGGLAGAGTLVRYGTVENSCSDVLMQFDAGRGTTERLSQLNLTPKDIDAVFITHVHSDHIEGLAGLAMLRWHFFGGEFDVVCSDDVATDQPPPERTMSCRGYVDHMSDAMLASGEVAQRYAENQKRHPDGPRAITRLVTVPNPLPDKPGTVVWRSGDVRVSAVGTTHIAGSLAYRVDTPAGSVVIGGDAGNSKLVPPRTSSTSETVELLANGADVLVHSTMHPVFGPDGGSTFPSLTYYRQSTAGDLGALATRAGIKHLMLTHMIPVIGAEAHGPYVVPGGPLTTEDFAVAAREGGFGGEIHVGGDLLTLRLP